MKILIGIVGCHNQLDERNAQRDTWLADLKGCADYRYFLGDFRNEATVCEVDELIVKGDDGPIRAGNYGHHTPVLRRKVYAMIKYAWDQGYDWLFKCDDDTYVRVDRLLAVPETETADYIGYTDLHSADDLGHYSFCVGAGYWLSRKAMQVIVDQGLTRHQSEDYAVGQHLASAGIYPEHDPRYKGDASAELLNDPGNNEPYIILHKVNPRQMHMLYTQDLERESEPPLKELPFAIRDDEAEPMDQPTE